MTQRIRTAAVAIAGALGLLVAPVALAAPAAAAYPAINVLFFSNGDFTSPTSEDATQIAALEEVGATVTVFNGGDGLPATWTAALAGKDALVIPESSPLLNSIVLPVESAEVIADWVSAGGILLLPTVGQENLLSLITGVDFTSVWSTVGGGGPWPFLGGDSSFPAQLSYSNGTSPINISSWTDVQYEASGPVYFDEDTDELAVGAFPVDAGIIYTLAYDWYPGTEPTDITARADWNIVQGLLLGLPVDAPAPAPQLAATGSSVEPGLYVGGAALLLLAGAAVVIVARRKAVA
ncbi:LPXTG cell wall anchor domain-containing protein [Antiquaquibacter soli]|uniref:LPXTG cell wall anchor domain-containing protein n=1 Tax=Antiquaquibacter soli TaxID=3064523 RepID=A0ABT9BK77_9MICO|nr:LPXTG cell wall anchor domain-containing protein [Protaetiibacter sp. WY-16]MDO7880959.1 LPXTG cell wall anchor domain-containing protein [Protaetiibacter sp. WY-16]